MSGEMERAKKVAISAFDIRWNSGDIPSTDEIGSAAIDAFLAELSKTHVVVPRDDLVDLLTKARRAFYAVASEMNYRPEHDEETQQEIALCDRIEAASLPPASGRGG